MEVGLEVLRAIEEEVTTCYDTRDWLPILQVMHLSKCRDTRAQDPLGAGPEEPITIAPNQTTSLALGVERTGLSFGGKPKTPRQGDEVPRITLVTKPSPSPYSL